VRRTPETKDVYIDYELFAHLSLEHEDTVQNGTESNAEGSDLIIAMTKLTTKATCSCLAPSGNRLENLKTLKLAKEFRRLLLAVCAVAEEHDVEAMVLGNYRHCSLENSYDPAYWNGHNGLRICVPLDISRYLTRLSNVNIHSSPLRTRNIALPQR